ncbi:MAG: helix-turn-helix domain-containing protein [Rhodospirillaceae bacterium]
MTDSLLSCPEQALAASADSCEPADPKAWCRRIKAQAEPATENLPVVLRGDASKPLDESAAWLLENGRVELDYLYNFIKPLGHVVLLADASGTIIGHRGERVENSQYRYWVSWFNDAPEAIKAAEASAGGLVCSGALLIDDKDEVLGILCATTPQPGASPYSHVMTGALAATAGRMIEERHFRAKYRAYWVIAIRPQKELGPGALVAVDSKRRIAAADRFARRYLREAGHDVHAPLDLWDVFEGANQLPWRRRDGDAAVQLTRVRDGEVRTALITPPLSPARNLSPEQREFQTRPRIPSLISGTIEPTAQRHAGGLPAPVVARVTRHIETHLGESISLRKLAVEAGLSPYHFARAFKQSQGITPLRFVLERRLARARELLAASALSLSDIAHAVGFADQSHFSRRFRDLEGVSPGRYRRQFSGVKTPSGSEGTRAA